MKKLSKKEIADFCRDNIIRVTDKDQRDLGELMLKIFNIYGAVDEHNINGLNVRLRLKTFPMSFLIDNPETLEQFTKLFMYIDGELIGTMAWWRIDHQHQMVKFHIDEDELYECMFLLKLAVD